MPAITLADTKLPQSYRKSSEISLIDGKNNDNSSYRVAMFASSTPGQVPAFFLKRDREAIAEITARHYVFEVELHADSIKSIQHLYK